MFYTLLSGLGLLVISSDKREIIITDKRDLVGIKNGDVLLSVSKKNELTIIRINGNEKKWLYPVFVLL